MRSSIRTSHTKGKMSMAFIFGIALIAFGAAPHTSAGKASIISAFHMPGITWLFDRRNDRFGTPHTNVFLRVNGRRVLVLQNAAYAFQVLSPQEYLAHAVPARAVAACTSWWAGQGEDLYVIRRNGRLVVFSRILDEQAPIPAYTRLRTIP